MRYTSVAFNPALNGWTNSDVEKIEFDGDWTGPAATSIYSSDSVGAVASDDALFRS